jgi:hypothetical protein
LPPDCPVDVQLIPWQAAPGFMQKLSATTPVIPKVKGKDVAWWSSHAVEGLPGNNNAWVICYNNWVLFLGSTGELAVRLHDFRESHVRPGAAEVEFLNAGPRRVVVPRDPEGKPIIPPA